jgi:hypothetical protein
MPSGAPARVGRGLAERLPGPWAALRLAVLGALITAPVPSWAASWERYVPRTLGQVIDLNRANEPAGAGDALLSGDSFPSRTQVRSRGQLRPLAGVRREFVVGYLTKVRGRGDWAELFRREALVEEGGVDYWIPIQESLAPAFATEVGPGDPVEIYVIWIGALKTAASPEWLFLINGFNHVPTPDRP